MNGLTLEQELLLVARGVRELAEGEPGRGVAYARQLVDEQDAGRRGVPFGERPGDQPPAPKKQIGPAPRFNALDQLDPAGARCRKEFEAAFMIAARELGATVLGSGEVEWPRGRRDLRAEATRRANAAVAAMSVNEGDK